MSYTKHNYQKGDELLASQLNDMDDQIALNEETADALVQVSNTEPQEEQNRVWVKATASEVEIPTMDDFDELNNAIRDIIAPEFSAENAYAVGDFCIHADKLYLCVRAKAAGAAWNKNANWELVSVSERDQLLDQILISDLLLEQGGIYSANGNNNVSTTRVRTAEYIYGNTVIRSINADYVVLGIAYYDATTGAFDSWATVNARRAVVGKTGCVARVVFSNVLGSTPIKPEELKRSLALEKTKEQLTNQLDKLNYISTYTGNAAGSFTIKLDMMRGKHYIFINNSAATCVMNLRARDTESGENVEIVRNALRQGSYHRYSPTSDHPYVWVYANAAYTLDVYEEETNLGMTIAKYTNAPKTAFDTDYTVYDYSTDLTGVTFDGTIMEQVYAKFDALMAQYPDYITKSDVANEAGIAYPVYANGVSGSSTYEDTPAYKTYMYSLVDQSDYNNAQMADKNIWANRNCPKNKLLITGGVHGNELCAPFDTYLFAKNLAENFLTNPNFFKLRTLFDVYIIPCVNGYGIYHNMRANANKVNINRNFPVTGWTVSGADTKDSVLNNYTGPSAGSEFETQVVMAARNIVAPDVYIDHHNYGGETKLQFYVETVDAYLARRIYKSLIDCAITFKKEYPSNFGTGYGFPQSNDGSAPGTTRIKTEGKASTWFNEMGVKPSATIEMSSKINYQNGVYNPEQNTPVKDVFALGEYTFRNVLMRMAESMIDHN